MNPMRNIVLEKVTLNMCAGDSGQKLESSKKVLSLISGKKVVITKTRKRSTFGVAKNRNIGVKITVRKEEAVELLKKLMKGVENKIKPSSFDSNGNFSFGIAEYIHIPGVSYDPDIGILGLDVAVTLSRPGFRVRKKTIKKGAVGKNHLITKEEAMKWAEEFGFKLVEKIEEEYF